MCTQALWDWGFPWKGEFSQNSVLQGMELVAGSCFCPYPDVVYVHPFMWQKRRFQLGAFSTASVRGMWAHCKLQTCDQREQSSESCRNAETAL